MPLDNTPEKHQTVQIAAPKMRVAKFKLIWTAPRPTPILPEGHERHGRENEGR